MNKALDYDNGKREYKIQIQASVSVVRGPSKECGPDLASEKLARPAQLNEWDIVYNCRQMDNRLRNAFLLERERERAGERLRPLIHFCNT